MGVDFGYFSWLNTYIKLCVDLKMDTQKVSGQRDWTIFSNIIQFTILSLIVNPKGGGRVVWSFRMEINIRFQNDLNTHTCFINYEGNCYIVDLVFSENLVLMTHLIIVGENWTTSTIGEIVFIYGVGFWLCP